MTRRAGGYAAARGAPPPGGGTGTPSSAYSLSLLRKVRIEMPSHVGGVRAVAQAMPERLQDEVALDLGDGAADERT